MAWRTRARPARHGDARATGSRRAPVHGRLGRLAIAAVGTVLLPLGLTGPTAEAATPTPTREAGLSRPIALPSSANRSPIDVTRNGATANRDTDDDSSGFRTAIGRARAGDVIFVPRGTYVFTKPNVVLPDGVSLRGERGAVIVAKFSTSSDNAGSSLFSVSAGSGNLTISDLRLTSSGGKALNYPLWIGSSSGPNVSRIAIRNMAIDRFHRMAISVRNGDNVTIENNTISDALATGDGGQGYGIMIGYPRATNNRVVGNVVRGPAMRHGILLQYSTHHNLVEGNTVSRTTYDAYDLHGEDEYANELRDNTAANCGEGGFGIGNTGAGHENSGPGNWIHHNTVTGCRWGIHIYRKSDQQYVEDNTFTGNTGFGISVHDEGAANLVLARNDVSDNGSDGIRLVKAPGVQLLDNQVHGNNGYALQTDAATTGYRIVGNDFRGNAKGVLRGSTRGTYSGNVGG